MATTTMHGHHDEHLEPVRGDAGHAVARPQPDDILFGPGGEEIKTLIASGDRQAARALYRRLTGADEREAEDLVTRLDMQINPQAYPEVSGARMAPAPAGAKGVLAVIVLVIAVLVVLAVVQAG